MQLLGPCNTCPAVVPPDTHTNTRAEGSASFALVQSDAAAVVDVHNTAFTRQVDTTTSGYLNTSLVHNKHNKPVVSRRPHPPYPYTHVIMYTHARNNVHSG
jgi:hypothetical protein